MLWRREMLVGALLVAFLILKAASATNDNRYPCINSARKIVEILTVAENGTGIIITAVTTPRDNDDDDDDDDDMAWRDERAWDVACEVGGLIDAHCAALIDMQRVEEGGERGVSSIVVHCGDDVPEGCAGNAPSEPGPTMSISVRLPPPAVVGHGSGVMRSVLVEWMTTTLSSAATDANGSRLALAGVSDFYACRDDRESTLACMAEGVLADAERRCVRAREKTAEREANLRSVLSVGSSEMPTVDAVADYDYDRRRIMMNDRGAPFDSLLIEFGDTLSPTFRPPRVPVPQWTVPADVEGFFGRVTRRVSRAWLTLEGISREHTQRALATHGECLLVQVVAGRAFVSDPRLSEHNLAAGWRVKRREDAVRLVATLAADRTRRLDDVEFVFCPVDCVTSKVFGGELEAGLPRTYHEQHDIDHPSERAEHDLGFPRCPNRACAGPTPAFTSVGCLRSFNIPFPTAFYSNFANGTFADPLTSLDSMLRDTAKQRRRHSDWWSKRDVLIFRGTMKDASGSRSCWDGTPGGSVVDGDSTRCGRRRLRALSLRGDLAGPRLDYGYDYVPMNDTELYRYQLVVEGHCGWADRVKHQLMIGSTLFMQHTFCREWYTMLMEPWVTHVPVDYGFNTLPRSLKWVRSRPTDAQQIAENMAAFAEFVLSSDGVKGFTRSLLNEFASVLTYDVSLREGALPAEDWLSLMHGCTTNWCSADELSRAAAGSSAQSGTLKCESVW